MNKRSEILDKAIKDLQIEIMNAWKSVMKYEEQMRDMLFQNDEILTTLIDFEKSKIEKLTVVLDEITPSYESEVNKAKETLRKSGYHVDSLWHVQDVTDRYECDQDKAYEILTEVLDANTDSVFDSIHHQAKYYHNLNEKKENN